MRPAAKLPRRRSPLLSLVAAAVLLLLALYLGQASRTAADPGRLQTYAGILVGAAIMLLILRLVRRR